MFEGGGSVYDIGGPDELERPPYFLQTNTMMIMTIMSNTTPPITIPTIAPVGNGWAGTGAKLTAARTEGGIVKVQIAFK
jgi:hypothetical protein